MPNSNIDEFNDVKRDAIGEVQNIIMGSAATAVSTLLDAKVWITTPRVNICKASEVSYPDLEPSIHVRIKYIKGITGASLLVLNQNDVQLILNQLMGLPLEVTDDFEFDEMNISAVSEVMNQMMGASATALSDLINTTIDISTPEAIISNSQNTTVDLKDVAPDDYVCTVMFNLTIDGVINSEFITILTLELAKEMADKMLEGYNTALDNYTEDPISQTSTKNNTSVQPQSQPVNQVPVQQEQPKQEQIPQKQASPNQPTQQHAQSLVLPDFGISNYLDTSTLTAEQIDNLMLLMNVPLTVSIEIGSARRKVKEILEFTPGTIIELEKQSSEPVDVIVNGNLIARGDIVVIDDNFAVRITEIVKSKLLDTLGNKE
jgi:flagellar motor switch protein FliN